MGQEREELEYLLVECDNYESYRARLILSCDSGRPGIIEMEARLNKEFGLFVRREDKWETEKNYKL